jgi:hypothetical protein
MDQCGLDCASWHYVLCPSKSRSTFLQDLYAYGRTSVIKPYIGTVHHEGTVHTCRLSYSASRPREYLDCHNDASSHFRTKTAGLTCQHQTFSDTMQFRFVQAAMCSKHFISYDTTQCIWCWTALKSSCSTDAENTRLRRDAGHENPIIRGTLARCLGTSCRWRQTYN